MSKMADAALAAAKAFEEHGYSPLLSEMILAVHKINDALAEPAEDGWRRCAVGQGETQHCGLLEAAVLAEREACARVVESLGRGHSAPFAEYDCVEAIRARGQE